VLESVLDTFRVASDESLLITHALAVLEEIVTDRSPGSKQGPALQLALRVLLPHAGDHPHYLYDFWLFAGYEQLEARSHNCRKTFGPVAGSVGRPNYRAGR
jgi:hypothetical protein